MTTFLDRLLGRPEPRRPSQKAVVSLGPWGSGTPLSSFSDTPQERAKAYLRAYKVGWFYKAGRKIADDIASLDWSVSDGDMEEGADETTLDRPPLFAPFESLSPIDQFQRLLERPNTYQTGRQLIRKTQVRLDFAGAACWYLAGGPLPSALYGISPTRMWPSYDKTGVLIGWVMDRDAPSGGVPFDSSEILWFSTGNAEDDDIWGTSVVQAVQSQVPLTDQMARHTSNVLTMGGRLAGMMWPKERALSEDEFVDAQRAWRNVASDPDAGKRLLIFPEPMEYAAGASTPAEIGIPELATLNRDEILTAFPVSPYRLGVPMPGGLNSGEVRREDRRDYWEETIHPRADLIEEVIQVGLLSRYEDATGKTYDFEIAEPNLDNAPSLLEKVAALRALASAGFDEKEAVQSVGLSHIKFNGIPAPDPVLTVSVGDTNGQDQSQTQTTLIEKPKPTAKSIKAREDVAGKHTPAVADFLFAQRERVIAKLYDIYPSAKADRLRFVKADPDWWDKQAEDAALRDVVAKLYLDAGKSSLQVVADGLGRIVPNKAVDRIVDDLIEYGGERIRDINARTLQSITIEIAEGTRRGYTIIQLIDGVPSEGYKGVLNVGLDNGVGVWGDARAETIARTETALSYNRAALDGYKEFRVQRVLAYDGDGDPECAARNGREFSVDDAFSIADHPNGTLDWAPITDKSYHVPDVQPIVVNVTTPEVKASDVYVTNNPPDVHVSPPNVYVEPAQVNVTTPDVHVTSPDIHVTTPDVTIHNQMPTVDMPPVIVNTGDTHVAAPKPVKVEVTLAPTRVTKTIERDGKGQITRIVEE